MRIFLAIAIMLAGLATATAVEVGDDGLHKQPWFATTFRDIKEDMATAKAEGKRLALIFEQRGCIYCRQIHEQILTDPEVRDFVKANYMVVQYNLYGDEEVTDLDGETLTEKTAARKWRVTFTPTIYFLPEEADGNKDVGASTVSVMPGAFRKGTFLDMFQWVHKKGYESDEGFQRYHARRITERRDAGQENTD